MSAKPEIPPEDVINALFGVNFEETHTCAECAIEGFTARTRTARHPPTNATCASHCRRPQLSAIQELGCTIVPPAQKKLEAAGVFYSWQ